MLVFKSVKQECPARVSSKISSKNVLQKCPAKVSSKSVKQECPARVSRESVKKDGLAKCVKKECLDGWGGAGAALVDDSASHLRKQERFECYASVQSDCIRVFYQVFFNAHACLGQVMFRTLLANPCHPQSVRKTFGTACVLHQTDSWNILEPSPIHRV